jgi:hypothetical protein
MAEHRGVSRAVLRKTDMAPLSKRRAVPPDDYSSGEKAGTSLARIIHRGS